MSNTPETTVNTHETPTVPEPSTLSALARDETPVEREIHEQAHADFLLYLHLAKSAAREHALADFESAEAERLFGALTGLAYADGRVQGTESESAVLANPAHRENIHAVTESAWSRVSAAREAAEHAAQDAGRTLATALRHLPTARSATPEATAEGVVEDVREAYRSALDLIRFVRENV